MGVNIIGLKSHTCEVRHSENGKLACNRDPGNWSALSMETSGFFAND